MSTFGTIFLVPFAANTSAFTNVSAVTRVLPFSLLALPYVIPTSWGSVTTHPHDSQSTYVTVFRTIATTSTLLHVKSTASAFFYNLPDSTYHRHSLLHPFREEHRSALNRSSTAVGRVFGAIGEHPAVSAVGWDVLLSGLSLGIWAAIRGLDAEDMLIASIPFTKRTVDHAGEVLGHELLSIKNETEKSLKKYVQPSKPSISSRRLPEVQYRVQESLTQARRRVGRPKKTEGSAVSTSKENNTEATASRRSARNVTRYEDEEYEPPGGDVVDEGDENADEDVEIAALAWGLITAGGLGGGSAAVYGAETLSR